MRHDFNALVDICVKARTELVKEGYKPTSNSPDATGALILQHADGRTAMMFFPRKMAEGQGAGDIVFVEPGNVEVKTMPAHIYVGIREVIAANGGKKFARPKQARRSTGAIYSAAELRATEAALVRRGFQHTKDDGVLGVRIYNREDGACATLHLDELNCQPLSSGIMFVSEPGKPVVGTAVHAFARSEHPGIVSALRAVVAPFFPKR